MKLLDGSLDFFSQFDGVGVGLLLDTQNHRRLTVQARISAFDGGRKRDFCNLIELDGSTVLKRHWQSLQVLQPGGATDVAYQVFARIKLEKAAAGIAGKALERRFDAFKVNLQRRHQRGVGLHLVLAHLAANRHHLGDAGQGQQARAHHEVGVFAHRHRTDLAGVNRQRQKHDLAHDRANRPHANVRDALRQLLARELQALAHHLAGAVNVGFPVEGDVDKRQADAGGRTDTLHPRYAGHGNFQWCGDQLLDFFWCHAPGLRLKRHRGFVQVGENIDRHLHQCQRTGQ